jgi:hypothetical protein
MITPTEVNISEPRITPQLLIKNLNASETTGGIVM